jgi:hypothetical protein
VCAPRFVVIRAVDEAGRPAIRAHPRESG